MTELFPRAERVALIQIKIQRRWPICGKSSRIPHTGRPVPGSPRAFLRFRDVALASELLQTLEATLATRLRKASRDRSKEIASGL